MKMETSPARRLLLKRLAGLGLGAATTALTPQAFAKDGTSGGGSGHSGSGSSNSGPGSTHSGADHAENTHHGNANEQEGENESGDDVNPEPSHESGTETTHHHRRKGR